MEFGILHMYHNKIKFLAVPCNMMEPFVTKLMISWMPKARKPGVLQLPAPLRQP